MAACPKISRGVFSKNFRPGGVYQKYPLPPIPVAWYIPPGRKYPPLEIAVIPVAWYKGTSLVAREQPKREPKSKMV